MLLLQQTMGNLFTPFNLCVYVFKTETSVDPHIPMSILQAEWQAE